MAATSPLACAACGHENPAEARFCNACGARIALRGAAPEPRAYTPRHLAERILASKGALEGERKPVTVLFADVVRSMEVAERLGIEEWHRLLDRLFRVLAEAVHRYEGTINQYTGDGVMALFGAPLAHEDHAERACAAALDVAREIASLADDVRRETGLELAVRMGLNSGEVVVGRIGDDLRMDYTAQGQVVGLADRVQKLAPPGGIRVTEATARLAADFFDLADLGPHELRGASGPVRVFALRGRGAVRSRLERSRARGFSRFVGRERELARLDAALHEARAGRPQVVLILGEPGAGKSRLCDELARRAGEGTFQPVRAIPHERGSPFQTLVELARPLLADSEAIVDPVARALWLELLGAAPGERAHAELEPDIRRERLFRSLADVVVARARGGLTLLCVEDLQWLDAASAQGLDALVERLLASDDAPRRVLLLATARPEHRPAWRERALALPLAPLEAPDAAALLDDWLGTDPSLAPLRARIEARARGNPLFLEEVVRSLVERGALRGERGALAAESAVDEIALPESVQAVVASRIDALSQLDKSVLQAAAVVGPELSSELVRAVVELPEADVAGSLERLAASELLRPAGSEGEWAFGHALTHEVAYRSQLLDRRRRAHGSVARALLAQGGATSAAQAARLAHHYEQADEPLAAARWHEQAGRRIARTDPDEGARYCRRVVELVAKLPESRETLVLGLTSRIALLEIGRIAGSEEAELRALFEAASAIAERLADPAGHAFLLVAHGRARGQAGDVAQYLACAERAAKLAQDANDDVLRFEMSAVLAHARLSMGHLEGARELAARALGDLARDPELYAALARSTAPGFCAIWWALASAYLGDAGAAQAALEALLADPREAGMEAVYGTHAFLCEVLRLRGDPAGALAHGRRAAEIAGERGSPFARVEAAAFLGAAALEAGEIALASDVLERALETATRRRTALWYEPRLLATLARARRASGDLARADALLADAARSVALGRGGSLGARELERARASG